MFFRKKVKTRSVIDHHVTTRNFTPGAESMAFEVNTQLPINRVRGNGTRTGALLITQSPQVYFNPQATLVGTAQQFGQFLSTPLETASSNGGAG